MNEPARPLIQLNPIGTVRNGATATKWGKGSGTSTWQQRTGRMKEQREAVSEIIIDREWESALDGIEEFSHIVVLYWPHQLPPETRATIKVHPLGSPDFPLTGVFATQSPTRPNPILTTTARLLSREANVLRVTGLDALDGSPVLDIKPYAPDDFKDIRIAGWMLQIKRQFDTLSKED